LVLVVKKVDERKLREFKAEAIRRGLTLSKAIEEAIVLWLSKSKGYVEDEVEANNRVFEGLSRELDKYRGKYVVIAHGKFLGAYDTLDEVSKVLKNLEPKVKHAIVFKVGVDEKVRGELEWGGGSIELRVA